MTYAFSDGVRDLSPSAIREILKYCADPEVVSLSAGNPAPEAFPVEEIRRISERLLREDPIGVLQYSTTEGYAPLRERVMADMRARHGVGGEEDDILITAGAQQVMGLMAKAFCNPGDVVLCEDPSFVGALNAFRALGAKLVGVPMEEDGLSLPALEAALKAHPNAKFLYTIPNFQNPAGVTMSWEKRQAVYALASRYGVLVLEDNPYGELRFAGQPVPAIKTLDTGGLVVYAGSFSKVLSPGLRVGYAIGPKAVLQKLTVAKQGEDVHTNIWAQRVCAEFLGGDFEGHLQKLRGIYKQKAERMMALLDADLCPLGVTYHPVEGGLFLWCTLPASVDMPAFCTRAVREYKVAVVPGNAFLADPGAPCQSFRVNYSTPTDEAMEQGVRRLADCLRACL